MLARFHGGPADGGELVLLEPVRLWVRFPMTAVDAALILADQGPAGGAEWLNTCPAGQYRLVLTPLAAPVRDTQGRILYAYCPVRASSTPTPTEGD